MDNTNRFLSYKEYHKTEVILLKFIINELPKLIPNLNTDDFELQEILVNPPYAVKPRIKTTDNIKQHQLYRYSYVTLRTFGVPRKAIKVLLRLRISMPSGGKTSLRVDGYLVCDWLAPFIEEIDITGKEFTSV